MGWVLRPAATFTETGNSTPPSPAVYSPTSRSKAARIRARFCSGWPSSSALVRTVPSRSSFHSSSALDTRWVNATVPTSDVTQAGALEERGELGLVGEAEERRADRDVGGRLGARFVRRFEEDAEQAHPLGDVPGGERDLPTGREHARHLGSSVLRPPEMEDQEVPDHRVERAVGEWEALGARLHELEPRMEPAGERDHLPRDVDADRRRAARGGGRGRVAGTGREIEHAGLRRDLRRVEQRLDHPRGERPERAVVAPCPLVPAGRLEGVEGFGVDGLRAHSAFDAGPKAGAAHRANRLIFRTRSPVSGGYSNATWSQEQRRRAWSGAQTSCSVSKRRSPRPPSGRGSTVLIAGEAGIGKTRLASELAERARESGATVLSGRCIDLVGSGLPYLPLVEALRPLRGSPALADVGSSLRELSRLVPELSEPGTPVPPDAGGPDSQLRLFEETLGVLEHVGAEAPLVLVLEDLHWADGSTLDLVAFLAHAAREQRMLLVATYRSDEVEPESSLRRLVAELLRAREAAALALEPLGRDEVARLLVTIAEAPLPAERATEICERSEGNPFFAEELVAAAERGEETLPRVLRDVLLQRLAGLDGETQSLLRVAAAAGRDVPYRLLAAVVPLSEAQLVEALRRTVEHDVLVPDQPAGSFRFRHALLAEAIYTTVLPGEREELHARLARALGDDPALAASSIAGELAHHWAAAGRPVEALRASIDAARDAAAVSGPSEAFQHLERVLELWPLVDDPEALVGLDLRAILGWAAEVAFFAGAPGQAAELIRRAISLADPADECSLVCCTSGSAVPVPAVGRRSRSRSGGVRAGRRARPRAAALGGARTCARGSRPRAHARRAVRRVPRHVRGSARGRRRDRGRSTGAAGARRPRPRPAFPRPERRGDRVPAGRPPARRERGWCRTSSGRTSFSRTC